MSIDEKALATDGPPNRPPSPSSSRPPRRPAHGPDGRARHARRAVEGLPGHAARAWPAGSARSASASASWSSWPSAAWSCRSSGPTILGNATNIIVQRPPARRTERHRLRRPCTGCCSSSSASTSARRSCSTCRPTRWPAWCSARCAACAPTSRTSSTAVPLRYIDRSARGDLLSRVTNDIDNLAQSLQQTISQLLTTSFMLVGTMVMMFVISPHARPGRRRHASRCRSVIIRFITKRSQRPVHRTVEAHRPPQRPGRGVAHRPRDREDLRAPAARSRRASGRPTSELYQASFGAQFISGSIQPPDGAGRQPELRGHRRHRRGPGGLRSADASAASRPSSSTRASSPSRSRCWRRWPTCSSPAWPRPSGCSSSSTHPRAVARRAGRGGRRGPGRARPGRVRARRPSPTTPSAR